MSSYTIGIIRNARSINEAALFGKMEQNQKKKSDVSQNYSVKIKDDKGLEYVIKYF